MSTAVENVFSSVISDVIENVKKDFEDMGVDESILKELEESWRKKVISQNAHAESYPPEYQQNNSNPSVYVAPFNNKSKYDPQEYGGTNSTAAELPKIAMTSTDNGNVMSRIPYVISGNTYQQAPNQPYTQSSVTPPNNNGFMPNNYQAAQVPTSIHMEQKVYLEQKVIQNQLRQQNQQNQEVQERHLAPRNNRNNMIDNHTPIAPAPTTTIQGVMPTFPASSITVPLEKKRRVTSLDDDEINSDLDDTDDENENAEGEETKNIILCLYDKVTRTKNKWKCQLKDGVMLVNGKDYLFQKGNGDFEF